MARQALPTPVPPRRNETSASERSEVNSAVRGFLLMGLIALVVVTTPVAFWIRAQAQGHALATVGVSAQRLADYVIAPLMTDSALAGDPAAIDLLDQRLLPWMDKGSVFRIKVWDEEGRIVYSDVPALIGQKFSLSEETLKAMAGTGVPATLKSHAGEDHEFEAGAGELVESLVSSRAVNSQPLVVETYYDGERVRREEGLVLAGMVPPFLLALAVLQLTQLLPAVRMARRIKAYGAARSRLLRSAIEASDLERQRIARDLHDEVIQDLSGLSYVLESEELHGSEMQRPLFAEARHILQENVRSLRAMTTELYPPDLNRMGLSDALARLGDPLQERGISVKLELPSTCDLDRDRSAMFYRVAREALANTAKHSRAGNAEVRLRQDGNRAEISIHDNGCGFDQAAGAPEGHMGLRIMKNTIREAGGTLQVTSALGAGTTVIARFGAALQPVP